MNAPPPGAAQIHCRGEAVTLVIGRQNGEVVTFAWTAETAREVARQIVEAADAIEGGQKDATP